LISIGYGNFGAVKIKILSHIFYYNDWASQDESKVGYNNFMDSTNHGHWNNNRIDFSANRPKSRSRADFHNSSFL
jgi:hypothetical protein